MIDFIYGPKDPEGDKMFKIWVDEVEGPKKDKLEDDMYDLQYQASQLTNILEGYVSMPMRDQVGVITQARDTIQRIAFDYA